MGRLTKSCKSFLPRITLCVTVVTLGDYIGPKKHRKIIVIGQIISSGQIDHKIDSLSKFPKYLIKNEHFLFTLLITPGARLPVLAFLDQKSIKND